MSGEGEVSTATLISIKLCVLDSNANSDVVLRKTLSAPLLAP